MITAEVVVTVSMPLETAIGAVTALGEFDLEDSDLGGAEALRELYAVLSIELRMSEGQ